MVSGSVPPCLVALQLHCAQQSSAGAWWKCRFWDKALKSILKKFSSYSALTWGAVSLVLLVDFNQAGKLGSLPCDPSASPAFLANTPTGYTLHSSTGSQTYLAMRITWRLAWAHRHLGLCSLVRFSGGSHTQHSLRAYEALVSLHRASLLLLPAFPPPGMRFLLLSTPITDHGELVLPSLHLICITPLALITHPPAQE